MLKRATASSIAALLLTLPLSAQVARAPARFSTSIGVGSAQHRRIPPPFFWGAPFWSDAYFPPSAPPPSVIVVPAPSVPEHPVIQTEEPKTSAPLLIEWQGDRYVRRASTAGPNTRATQPDYIADANTPIDKHTAAPLSPRSGLSRNESTPSEPPPTVFIFRDGHREESSDYSIISGVIYARGDYWTSGQWSKQIPVAQLDLPASVRANQERGVTFRLPAGPNEVITRP
jgi:hypothetical protein